jgi:NADPH:quinone reductase-like Zn-dependent oxidoreductase
LALRLKLAPLNRFLDDLFKRVVTMKTKTWQFTEYGALPAALNLVEQELPEPGPGEALIKVTAIGMNRSEFNYVQGKYAPAREFPSNLGQEVVGEIVALGPDGDKKPHSKTSLAIGARVAVTPGKVDMCGAGTYRDYGLYNQEALIPIPEGYSDEEAASLWMAVLTAGGCFNTANLTPENAAGKTVLVTAASSSIGVLALKMAKAWGAKTIATTRSSAKAAEIADIADHVVVCSNSDELGPQLTELGGFDVAIDPVGPAFIPAMVAAANFGAVIVSYEMITGPQGEYSIPQVLVKDLTLKGFALFNIFRHPGLCELLVDQGLHYADQIRPIIAKTIPLSAADDALAELGESNHLGKFVLIP